MIFSSPAWLLLAIPLGISMNAWRMPTKFLRNLRILTVFLIILALGGPAIRYPGREGVVTILADRSRSMPNGSMETLKEMIDIVQGGMPEHCRMAVVSFGERVAVETPPGKSSFTGFVNDVGGDGSSLDEAIEKAVSIIPRDTSGRVLILSDGRWTGVDPSKGAFLAAGRGIAIDYRNLSRSTASDLAFDRVDAPSSVTPGESFLLTAWVRSPLPQTISFEVLRDTTVVASYKKEVPSGLSRIFLRDKAQSPGVLKYRFRVTSTDPDPVPENNNARVLVGVEGRKSVLLISESTGSSLPRLLKQAGVEVSLTGKTPFSWSLEDLSEHSAVILENYPAQSLGGYGMKALSAWVTQIGGGLMLTGGKSAYGPGGYFHSPLDPILPVSMELRSEHRKLSLAVAIIMDRSGSMAMSAGGGRTKMDLANLSVVQVLDILSPMDEIAIVAVDSSPHIIVPLSSCKEAEAIRDKVLGIQSEGGGIYVYEGLSQGAALLSRATAQTRHMILFADAADSEEPGDYVNLLDKCAKANMTCSVIGLGKESDCDANLLKDVAAKGNGRIFFTENPDELPRLFAQDTFVAARSTFIDEATPVKSTSEMIGLTQKPFEIDKTIGGYNLCYLRDSAICPALTLDEYKAPLVAAWQQGLGRVLCYTGEADGKSTGEIAGWPEIGNFFASLAKWTAGPTEGLPGNVAVTQETVRGIYRVRMHLDPAREHLPFSALPELTTLRTTLGGKPVSEKAVFSWESADTLVAEFPLTGEETVLSTVKMTKNDQLALSPVCLPYSAEFSPSASLDDGFGLEHLGNVTGGRERLDLEGIWKDLPRTFRFVEISPFLLLFAILFLLAEVLERRTGFISSFRIFGVFDRLKSWIGRRSTREQTLQASPTPSGFTIPASSPEAGRTQASVATPASRSPDIGQPGKAPAAPAAPAVQPPAPPPQKDLLGALRDARRQVKKRSGLDNKD